MSNKLAPCPFCGKAPIFRYVRNQPNFDDGVWTVRCNDIYCGRGLDIASTQREVGNLWNRQWADRRARGFLRLQREHEKLRKKLLKVQFLLSKSRLYRLKIPRDSESVSSRTWRIAKLNTHLTGCRPISIKEAMRYALNSEYASYLRGLPL